MVRFGFAERRNCAQALCAEYLASDDEHAPNWMTARATVLVTGVAGDLGSRLVPELRAAGHEVVGVDRLAPRNNSGLLLFQSADLATEASCSSMAHLLRDTGAQQVVHLAFILDPRKSGVLDVDRMWQINVAGTARVCEAITEANRRGGRVRQLIHMSSVAAYGAKLPLLASEQQPLAGDGLTYARHKREADLVVQTRASQLGNGCSAVILRPQIFSGPGVHNYMIDALRGAPSAPSAAGQKMVAAGRKLPLVMPWPQRWKERQFQFVHVDDVARVIAWFIAHPIAANACEAFNVAARGPSLSVAEAAQTTGVEIRRLPSRAAVALALKIGWRSGVSNLPPEALPFVLGEYTLSTEKLRRWIGAEYEDLVRYTNAEALRAAVAPASADAAGKTP